jgi:signal transduction histidine kinase
VEWARYVRTGESRNASAIAFRDVRVAVLSDSFGTRWLAREHPSAVQVPVNSIAEGLQALIEGQADALLTLKLPTRHLIRGGMEGRVEEVGTELTAPMSLAVAPRSRDVIPALNAAIDKLTASGEIERLRNLWMPPAPRTAAEISERRMAMLLAGLVGILMLLSGVLWTANRRLARARHQAEEARQAKSNFLAVMSHEIRTPINGLVNLIDLLQRTRPNAEQADLLNKAEQANRSLLSLVNQVLDFSKIEASRMEIVARPMRLEPLMERVQAVLSSQPRAEGVTLRVSAIPSDWPTVMADEQRLAQVLINLGGNALKFTLQGQVQVLVSRLHPAIDEQSRLRLRLEVQDTGPGIEPEEIKRLFQPFVQLKEGLSRPHAGTGLGLSTSAELVRQMGSHLEVSSTPGQLTCFWFDLSLPIAESADAADAEVVAAPAAPAAPSALNVDPGSRPSLREVRVMVVDDNPLNLLVTRKILEQEGCAVMQAAGAEEALSLLGDAAQPRPDIILMDLHMPQVDGLEATRRLRDALGPNLPPVLAVSGAVTDDAREAARAVGMAGFVPKPFERATLLQAIEAHLRVPA